jgi:hypothetical protein
MRLMVDFIPQNPNTGRLMGLCEVCEGTSNRMIARASLPVFGEIFEIFARDGEEVLPGVSAA